MCVCVCVCVCVRTYVSGDSAEVGSRALRAWPFQLSQSLSKAQRIAHPQANLESALFCPKAVRDNPQDLPEADGASFPVRT